MITYQDFLKETNKERFIQNAVSEHKSTSLYTTALDANYYDKQKNTTIRNYVKTIIGNGGRRMIDITATNSQLCSNFFRRLNTQRNMYSLGNGISFGKDGIKKKLGNKIDTRLQDAAYKALIHGVSFLFWNIDKVEVFPITEFCPLYDEETGALRAGIRFWQIDSTKPIFYTLFEEDGYTKYRSDSSQMSVIETKRAYQRTIRSSRVSGDELVNESNYDGFPVVPLYGSKLKQSTLVGMKQKIDSYDLISSGFANDLTDCSQIYWIVSNAGGMTEKELSQFRQRLLFQHIATVDGDDGVEIKPYTQEIPFQSRTAYLALLRNQIYDDFGAFDCSSISAAAKTATEINAAYQPMDENADDFEYQIISAVEKLLALQGVTGDDAVAMFKRNRIANQTEQTQMVMTAASVLDEQSILEHLPFLTPEEVQALMERKAKTELDIAMPEDEETEE